jgi:peroxiredoxin
MATEAVNSTPLGSPVPNFSLPDVVFGATVTLDDLPAARALLVMFICRHCPYVVHVREEILRLAADYQPRGVWFLAVCSNDPVAYPDDGPDRLRDMALEIGLPFPLLHDPTQDVARAFDAKCTPDFFLYDNRRRLAYRGRLDDSTPGNKLPVTGREMRTALDAVLGNLGAPAVQKPAIGCSIKWKP